MEDRTKIGFFPISVFGLGLAVGMLMKGATNGRIAITGIIAIILFVMSVGSARKAFKKL